MRQQNEVGGHPSLASKSPQVLVVDDEEILRSILRFMLEENGCKVTESQSGNEAWSELSHNDVDLVISDIRMPDGDGLELLDRIQKKGPHHPTVILVTAYSDITEEEARARGAVAMFSKPFDYGIFLQKVDDVLHGHH